MKGLARILLIALTLGTSLSALGLLATEPPVEDSDSIVATVTLTNNLDYFFCTFKCPNEPQETHPVTSVNDCENICKVLCGVSNCTAVTPPLPPPPPPPPNP